MSMAIQTDIFPGQLESYTFEKDYVDLRSVNALLRIYIVTDSIIRFRYSTTGFFQKDFSYAINPHIVKGYTTFDYEIGESEITLRTEILQCRVNRDDLKITISDHHGLTICKDEKGFHWEPHPTYGGDIVKISKEVQEKENYFGLGDKPEALNMKGKRFKMWGEDVYGFQRGQDPLYKNIPFYMGMHHETAYGIFFDNTFLSQFDFASERKSATSFWAHGGEMNYYFIAGPEVKHVLRRYANLTGVPEMPPLWTLGFHQCKWSYYPESKVREVTTKFRELKIPCDAIYLDIDYMDGFRCFTWDLEKFPDPKGMVDDLKEQGFKTIVIIDPGIKVDEHYSVFKEAFEKDYFCKRADGPYMKGKVWPGDCYFPDFTNPEVRSWWADLFKELIDEIGIGGVWNDMNEPAVFEVPTKTFPDDVRHNYDGNHCSHRKAHNIYGMQMARASYEGVKKYAYPNRPFLITRSLYAGTQRFSSAWTGDNMATWEHLFLANVQCLRMCLSGYSFIGSDVGGFIEQPTPELFVRWIQLATFHPFFRVHSSGDHGDQEPWSFGAKSLKITRSFIELRYQLLPYLYTTFYQYHSKGRPFLRPLFYEDQSDQDTYYRNDEFFCGDHLLVSPILEPNSRGRYHYLPKGSWYHFWDDRLEEGGREIWEEVDLQRIPIYVRAGAVIPMFPVQQYVGEKKIETLTLIVYYSTHKVSSMLYEDRGDGYDYMRGNCNVVKWVTSGNGKFFNLNQSMDGAGYNPSYEKYEMIIKGLPFKVSEIQIDNEASDIGLSHSKNEVRFVIERKFSDLMLKK